MVIRGDILDLTDLQRRGLLKKAEGLRKQEESDNSMPRDDSGYVDFSKDFSVSNVGGGNSVGPSGSSIGVGGGDLSSGGVGGDGLSSSGGDLLSGIFGGAGSNGGSFWGSDTGSSENSSVSSAEGPDVSNPLGFMEGTEKKVGDGSGGFGSFWDVGNSAGESSKQGDNLEVQGLKNKIDDLEYKIDRLMEKVAELESR